MTPATDAGEFAALAAKRWFYYTREGATVTSVEQLRDAIRHNQRTEIAFLLVASAKWVRRHNILALAYCRRTWCHHLVLDFLAVRPDLPFAKQPIHGIGTGVIFGLATLAEALGMKLIWGEATAYSSPFYAHVLNEPRIDDHFFIRGGTLEFCRREFREKFFGGLD